VVCGGGGKSVKELRRGYIVCQRGKEVGEGERASKSEKSGACTRLGAFAGERETEKLGMISFAC
jgi:hypothetical protein